MLGLVMGLQLFLVTHDPLSLMVAVHLVEVEPICLLEIGNGGGDITIDLVRVLSLNLLFPSQTSGSRQRLHAGKNNIYIFALFFST